MLDRRLVLSILFSFLIGSPAVAGSVIETVHPWARPTLPNRPGVVYLGIRNSGDAPDRLTGARADGVGRIEIHKAAQTGTVMTMEPVEAVEIPAGGMAHLRPGGLHLMMFGIDPPLKGGDTLDVTLIFEGAGEIDISVPVSKTMGGPQHRDGDHQPGMQHQHNTTGN